MRDLVALICSAALVLSSTACQAVGQEPVAAATPPVSTSGAVLPPGGTVPLDGKAADASSLDYVLGVADKVRITVYNEASLTGEFPVNANGAVSLPLIGEVPAIGRTAGELRDRVAARLADGYLKNPRVAIDVLTFRPYYILGEVTKAGEYPFSNGLTVMNAVATAQGFTYRANKKQIFLKRAGETQEKRVTLTADLMVHPGDTIRVTERFF